MKATGSPATTSSSRHESIDIICEIDGSVGSPVIRPPFDQVTDILDGVNDDVVKDWEVLRAPERKVVIQTFLNILGKLKKRCNSARRRSAHIVDLSQTLDMSSYALFVWCCLTLRNSTEAHCQNAYNLELLEYRLPVRGLVMI